MALLNFRRVAPPAPERRIVLESPMPARLLSILTALALLAPATGHANDLLRLYQEALVQDQTLHAARYARDASVEARPQAWAAVLPQLSASGGIQRQEIKTASGSRIINNQVVQGGNFSTSRTWAVNFDDTIFSFAAFLDIAQSNVQVAAAENTFLGNQQDLVMRVAQAYFTVLSARDTVRADTAARDAFKAEMDEAEARFKVGLSTITAVQQAKSSFDSANATLIGDQQALDNARQALGVIVGRDVSEVQPLRPEIPLVPPAPSMPDDWVARALDDNFDVRSARLQRDIAQREVGIQRAQRLPTIDLQGAIGRSSVDNLPDSARRSYAIGLAVNLPLFQGGMIRSRVRQASATAAQDEAQFQLAQRTTKQQVLDAYRGVLSGIASVTAFKQAVASSNTALESTRVGFRVGTQTEIDVLTAQQNLYSALKSYFLSRYDYLTAGLTLKQRTGHLTVADLERVDALLDPEAGEQQQESVLP